MRTKITIGCFGLTYKADVQDLRESPALSIVQKLINQGHNILTCEPNLITHDDFELFSLEYVLEFSDFLVFLVPHSKFSTININNKEFFDPVGLFDI